MKSSYLTSILALTAVFVACGDADDDPDVAQVQQAFSSPKAGSALFEFDGTVVTDCSSSEKQIWDQLYFTVGYLNQDNSVSRLDSTQITNVQSQPQTGGKCLVTYHAKMPVGFGLYQAYIPNSYTFKLPRDLSSSGRKAFFDKYHLKCKDWTDHETLSSYWYYYRTNPGACQLQAADISVIEVKVTTATDDSDGKYPEYHRIWADGELNVILIVGMYGDGTTSATDPNIAIYSLIANQLKGSGLGNGLVFTTEPANVPNSPGLETPRIKWSGSLPDGRKIVVNQTLITAPEDYSPAFDSWYKALTPKADLIFYNGHAGLGANIRALARKGKFVQGQYTIVSMMGCDTYAYIDDALAKQRRELNPDDVSGTKYLDMMANLTPTKPGWLVLANINLIKALIEIQNPASYVGILRTYDSGQFAVAIGDHDNEFRPGMPIVWGPGEDTDPDTDSGPGWAGMTETGTVARGKEARYQTPELARGTYIFTITGSGDADLYVRKGAAPTTSTYDCRPYKAGSRENCVITLDQPSAIHIMVRGWAATSDFELKGSPESRADMINLPDGETRGEGDDDGESDGDGGCSVAGSPVGSGRASLFALLFGRSLYSALTD